MTFQDYYLIVEFLVRCGSPESIEAACAIAWATMCSGRCSDVANIKQTSTNPIMTDRKLMALKPFQPKVRQVKQLVMAARMKEFELDVLLLWIYHIALSGPLALDSEQEAPLFPSASTERESRNFFKKWLDFAIAGLLKEGKGQLLTPQLTPHSLRNLVWQMVLRHCDCNVEAGSKHAGWEKRNHQGAREKYSGFNEEQEDRVARCAVGCIDLSCGGEFPELMPVSSLTLSDIHWETYEFARLLAADNFHRISPSMIYAGTASMLSNYLRMKTKFGSDHIFTQLPLRIAGMYSAANALSIFNICVYLVQDRRTMDDGKLVTLVDHCSFKFRMPSSLLLRIGEALYSPVWNEKERFVTNVQERQNWMVRRNLKIGADLDRAWILKQVESVDVAVIDSSLGLPTGPSGKVLKSQGSLLHSLQVLEMQNKVMTHQLMKLDQVISAPTEPRQATERQFAAVLDVGNTSVDRNANSTSGSTITSECSVTLKDTSVCRIPAHWPPEITSLNKMSISKLWIAWHAEGLGTGS
ncbi:hypothetical protein R1sor_002738 [Riccia sorocarpa]|uniref:Uncharacterized protein n=1 Tax=Riccia sorocarpa TaxID=122646 RepID=A0ABD3H3T8_9MARC